jgi:hypothetical protein
VSISASMDPNRQILAYFVSNLGSGVGDAHAPYIYRFLFLEVLSKFFISIFVVSCDITLVSNKFLWIFFI